MAYDGQDPPVEREYDETDEYIDSLIVFNGQLTQYGEQLYEQSREAYYDEESGEWIYV